MYFVLIWAIKFSHWHHDFKMYTYIFGTFYFLFSNRRDFFYSAYFEVRVKPMKIVSDHSSKREEENRVVGDNLKKVL